jgi:3-isopropylmalate dehydrogenase
VTVYKIGLMHGDGIGPEVVPAAVSLVDAACAHTGAALEWLPLPFGAEAIRSHGDPVPASTKEALADTHGWILGPHDSASYPAEWHASRRPTPGGEFRHDFDLYANIRPARNLAGVPSMVKDTDLVVVRENTEGFYADRNMFLGQGEIMPSRDVCLAIGVFTRRCVERIVRDGFEMARERRKHLTVVHKANVLPLSTGMYKTVALEMAPDYPDVTVDDFHADAVTAHLLRHPERFDVIVTENMFGDLLSDMAGELTGGLGLGAAINAGDQHAMAQAVHGGAPDIAGQNIANPIAEMMSALMLIRWIGGRHKDDALIATAEVGEKAVHATLSAGIRTTDLSGTYGTREFAEAAVSRVGETE